MKALVEALDLNQPEEDYFFHIVGHLSGFGFKTLNETEYKDKQDEIRSSERENAWVEMGVTYRNQAEILKQCNRYLSAMREGLNITDYLNLHKNQRDLTTSKINIRADRANWKSNNGFGAPNSYIGEEV